MGRWEQDEGLFVKKAWIKVVAVYRDEKHFVYGLGCGDGIWETHFKIIPVLADQQNQCFLQWQKEEAFSS